uniref:C-type lectin domain-containing protein n=1 Tax=Acanthochromis polyacanthus TaxID=80966 RepID=A0A3Q1G3H9_9TELE
MYPRPVRLLRTDAASAHITVLLTVSFLLSSKLYSQNKPSEISCFCASSPPSYVFKNWTNLTWEEAQSYCMEFHTDLASVRNEEESTLIQQIVKGIKYVFVGLSRKPWPSWSDGTEHKFKNWLIRHPSSEETGDCATSLIGATDAGKWVEDHCDRKLPFMCHYGELSSNKLTLTVLH